MSTSLTSAFSRLKTFARSPHVDDENLGDKLESDSVGGGGHAARKSKITKSELRVSHALKNFLVREKVLSEDEVGLDSDRPSGALRELLDRSHIDVPSYVTDRSHPLSEYYISSSHNTYLLAHQLYGGAAASAYQTALTTGSRCVEIDAWDDDDNENEPKVTHGYTLASNVPFRAVCETVRDVIDHQATSSQGKPAPIWISLENHCDAHGQLRLAEIMREVWGQRLLSQAVREHGTKDQHEGSVHISLDELDAKICVIVEYHIPAEADDDPSSSSSDEDEAENDARRRYKQKRKETPKVTIVPELAELGVYAQSVKPSNQSWLEGELTHGPHHHLINVSESAVSGLVPKYRALIGRHNALHLMRVYPKGTRISSANLNPVPFWGVGAQVCALNWQTFDASMQLNEALFSGSDGYVLKPAALRSGGTGHSNTGGRKRLRLHVAGATDLPVPEGHSAEDIRPYVTCTLVHPDDLDGEPPKRKTSVYKQHKLGIVHKGEQPPPTHPIWDEVLDWDYEDNDLAFLRILVKSDDKFAKNPVFAVAAVRLLYVVRDWSFIRLLDLKGRETHCSLLVKFQLDEVRW